ncbi:MAG: alkyl/aryl-sulfatase [bacterium]
MNIKASAVFVLGVSCGVILAAVVGCIKWHSPETVVREPEQPGESALEYTPPQDPSLSVEFVSDVGPMLGTMLGPETVKVNDDVYAAVGYGFGTIVMVITDDGLVIVDTGVSREAAREVLSIFRNITKKPVRYILYTHSHQDHTLGSSVFYHEGVEVIATNVFKEYQHYQSELLTEHINRSRAIQFGFIEPEYAFPLPVQSDITLMMEREWPEIVPPTQTFENELEFSLGGKRFVLFAAPGETPCQMAVWLPDQEVLISGDNYYHSFPNLSTPLLEPRPVRDWIESLGKYIDLEPQYLVPGHTDPISGKEKIRRHLKNYREAVKYVHDETVRCINQGKSVDQAVREIELPDRLAGLPYLQEYYGQVDWSVRGIYRGYTGWYQGGGTGLNPLPDKYKARELVRIAGADGILDRAIELQKKGEHQLCAELCDVVINANPDDKLAHRVKAQSMYYLAYASRNLNSFLCYRSAYSRHMKAAGIKPQAMKTITAPRPAQ